jgi:hypothetical protein
MYSTNLLQSNMQTCIRSAPDSVSFAGPCDTGRVWTAIPRGGLKR